MIQILLRKPVRYIRSKGCKGSSRLSIISSRRVYPRLKNNIGRTNKYLNQQRKNSNNSISLKSKQWVMSIWSVKKNTKKIQSMIRTKHNLITRSEQFKMQFMLRTRTMAGILMTVTNTKTLTTNKVKNNQQTAQPQYLQIQMIQ